MTSNTMLPPLPDPCTEAQDLLTSIPEFAQLPQQWQHFFLFVRDAQGGTNCTPLALWDPSDTAQYIAIIEGDEIFTSTPAEIEVARAVLRAVRSEYTVQNQCILSRVAVACELVAQGFTAVPRDILRHPLSREAC